MSEASRVGDHDLPASPPGAGDRLAEARASLLSAVEALDAGAFAAAHACASHAAALLNDPQAGGNTT